MRGPSPGMSEGLPMPRLIFVSHPEVMVDPTIPVARWRLSDRGIARMRGFAEGPLVADVGSVWASGEAKAIEAAGILAARLAIGVAVDPGLGENDRTATGFLPPAAFEQMADAFFARPEASVRGWERAVDAQARIVAALGRVLAAAPSGDVAVVSHGAVGTLLRCAWEGRPIGRDADQPFQGHYWTATLPARRVEQGWQSIGP